MRYLKPFIILQLILIIQIFSTERADAIIVAVPVVIGAVKLTLLFAGVITLPVTFISAFINIDFIKESKLKFFLLTLLTWLVILTILSVGAYWVIEYFDINQKL